MDKVEDIILMHMYAPGDYDPQAAHEYYLRTRKLKGRTLGSTPVKSGRSSRRAPYSPKAKVRKTSTVSPRVRAIMAQISHLQGSLVELRKALADLIAKDKEKASAPKKAAASTDSKSSSDDKPLTAEQKKDAADRAKKSYEKNKAPGVQTREQIRAKIKEVETKLLNLKADLAEIKRKTNQSKTGSTPKPALRKAPAKRVEGRSPT